MLPLLLTRLALARSLLPPHQAPPALPLTMPVTSWLQALSQDLPATLNPPVPSPNPAPVLSQPVPVASLSTAIPLLPVPTPLPSAPVLPPLAVLSELPAQQPSHQLLV